ncbi:MAG: ABC transporter permease subunit [Anaerolineaceae bacterium]|nr:ABC transporter permease subunit [Anaerolineaceae bacterium]
MALPVFRETLRRSVASTIYWGLAFAALALLTVVMLPGAEMLQTFADFMASMPLVVIRAMGVGEDLEFLATAEGFIAVGFFSKMLIFFVAYPLVMGTSISAGEEENGSLEVLLSLPLPRWRVIVEKYAAYLVTMTAILLILYGGILLGVFLAGVTLDLAVIRAAVFNLFPSMCFIMGVTTLVGAYVSQARYVLGIVATYIIVSFLLDVVGDMGIGTVAENLSYISFFRYGDSVAVMQHGLEWSSVVAFLVAGVALMLLSTRVFDLRDIRAD